MLLKSSLEFYRQGETSLGAENFSHGNRRGDVLLVLARAGDLSTTSHNENPQGSKLCFRFGIYEETAKHIIFECYDANYTNEDFLPILGLKEEMKDPSPVSKTKRVLQNREKEADDLFNNV